ncbi:MAG: radical SAM family heme chaperone HemW [Deltaproteobacteria bacterium]|nr:radical SAM family heme chaperone HemW [Deltaproteobacteria bacterium]
MMKMNSIGVYIHIPFCLSKCPYCDFNSVASGSVPEARYAACVLKEFNACVGKEGIDRQKGLGSVYFGGGTPSVFSPAAIGGIIRGVTDGFGPQEPAEVTLEVNPDTVDAGRLEGFRKAGVNRLSIGAQSLDDGLLKMLGRRHSAKKALNAFRMAREAGFENIGIDLMFGLPGQTLALWKETLKTAVALRPRHVSLYGLTIEEGTPFGRLLKNGSLSLLPEEVEIEMYKTAIDTLAEAGCVHYEISNFALPGYFSVHNSGYWQGIDCIGLGAGAHSYMSAPGWGRRWWNALEPEQYMERIALLGNAVEGSETLKMGEASAESLMLGLRMLTKGIVRSEFKQRFGILPEDMFKRLKEFEAEGYIKNTADSIILTPKGALISNELFSNMLA